MSSSRGGFFGRSETIWALYLAVFSCPTLVMPLAIDHRMPSARDGASALVGTTFAHRIFNAEYKRQVPAAHPRENDLKPRTT
jgi:hypothetical protein